MGRSPGRYIKKIWVGKCVNYLAMTLCVGKIVKKIET
jgi:hypothetical protein